MSDWTFENVQELRTKRQIYANRYYLHADYMRNDFKVPELLYTPEQDEEISQMLRTVCIYNTRDLFTIEIHQLASDKLSFNHNIINHIYNIS